MKVTREITLTLDIEYRPIRERSQTETEPGETKGYDIISACHNGVELDLSKEDGEYIENELMDNEPDVDDEDRDD
jgi:hypothetical protein